MNLCDYGCGQEAKYQFKNGKNCCCDHWRRCPTMRKKSSDSNKGKNNGFYGKKHLEKNKRKMSESSNGKNNGMYGKKHSEKTRKKMSKSQKGAIRTEEWKRKQSISQKGKKMSEEAKKKMSESQKGKNNSFWKGGYGNVPLYDTLAHQIDWCEEVRRNEEDENILEVKCTYCGKWYIPKMGSVCSRISALNGKYTESSESRLYCSDHCKKCCPVYGKMAGTLMKEDAVRAGRDPWWEMIREVQPQLRQMVLKRDDYKCTKCGSKEFLHCHHIEGILWEPLQSADIDMCITVCKDCHMVIHKIDGCKPSDMRCN